jgi:hypothetical protein
MIYVAMTAMSALLGIVLAIYVNVGMHYMGVF